MIGMICLSRFIQRKSVIFFGCSMRGGQDVVSEESLRTIQGLVKKLGYALASEHQTQEGTLAKENKLDPRQIMERDCGFVLRSSVAIFEISNPSLGVGAEIMLALLLGKPILCLHFQKPVFISAFIRGMEKSRFTRSAFKCCQYCDLTEVEEAMNSFLAEHC